MAGETTPVATVTGLYRYRDDGFEPLTRNTPLTQDEVRDAPVFFELELADNDTDLVMDVSYDNMEPVRLPDHFRGMDIPRGVRFWPAWFEVPPYREMLDLAGRRVYPRAPGIHTVRIRIAQRLRRAPFQNRNFPAANRGSTSPVFELAIAADTAGPSGHGEGASCMPSDRRERETRCLRPNAPAFKGGKDHG